MSHSRFSNSETAKRGRAVFEQAIRRQLKLTDHGKSLVLDVESGKYELDHNELAAVTRARAKRPEGVFYMLRVGHRTAFRLRRRALPAPAS